MSHYPLGLLGAKPTVRVIAFIIDILLLSFMMVILDFTLPESSALIRNIDLVFYSSAFLYFSLLGSKWLNGQTLGKRMMGIRVFHVQGELLTVWQSMMRYSQLIFPLYAINSHANAFNNTTKSLSVGLLVMTLYFLIFNRRTGQTLHDLSTQSLVVPAIVDNEKTTLKSQVWPVHYGIGLSFAITSFIFIQYIHAHPTTHPLPSETLLISLMPHITKASVYADNQAQNEIVTKVNTDQRLDHLQAKKLAEQIQYIIAAKNHHLQPLHSKIEVRYTRSYGLLHWNHSYSLWSF